MASSGIPLGVSEFRKIREEGLTYVDKSLFIREIAQDSAESILLTRPRRFGKTLGLSLLRTHFERSSEDLWPLFEGLAIAEDDALRKRRFQRHPTIDLTFKDVKARTWAGCRTAVAEVLGSLYGEHRYLLSEGSLHPEEADAFRSVLTGQAQDARLWASLKDLSAYLARHHRERVLILVDEYDTPIHSAYVNGYYDEAIEFFRNLLSGGLKDNRHLWKGVMTGVLRVAKDSVLTGLNNLDVYSLLRSEYAGHFGFREEEVQALLEADGHPELMDDVRRWYNGYVFGGEVVYNPWSVLSFIKGKDRVFRPFWIETSSNDLVRELLVEHGLGLRPELEALLRGEPIERMVTEPVSLRQLRPEDLWSLLVFTGHLAMRGQCSERGQRYDRLAVPNLEVESIYRDRLLPWSELGQRGDARRAAAEALGAPVPLA